MNFLKKLFALVAICAATGAAQATVISGNLNNIGYSLISFHVNATTAVDFQNPTGIADPGFALFNSAGKLLIYADDSVVSGVPNVKPHLTQTLVAGSYKLLVSACCAAIDDDWIFQNSDGVNGGIFYKSATATLASVIANLSAFPQNGGAAYQLTASNIIIDAANVPEPGSMALFGISVAALGLGRRRRQPAGQVG